MGVGAAIASGNHTVYGNIALLVIAPRSKTRGSRGTLYVVKGKETLELDSKINEVRMRNTSPIRLDTTVTTPLSVELKLE
jgi:hypothetical protein